MPQLYGMERVNLRSTGSYNDRKVLAEKSVQVQLSCRRDESPGVNLTNILTLTSISFGKSRDNWYQTIPTRSDMMVCIFLATLITVVAMLIITIQGNESRMMATLLGRRPWHVASVQAYPSVKCNLPITHDIKGFKVLQPNKGTVHRVWYRWRGPIHATWANTYVPKKVGESGRV